MTTREISIYRCRQLFGGRQPLHYKMVWEHLDEDRWKTAKEVCQQIEHESNGVYCRSIDINKVAGLLRNMVFASKYLGYKVVERQPVVESSICGIVARWSYRRLPLETLTF